jgi:hypothetical protein
LFAPLSLVCHGCTPLVATVGVEADEPANEGGAWLEPLDGGPALDASAQEDAPSSTPDAAEGLVDDAGEDAASIARNCIVLPDLLDAFTRTDGGITALDSGVVWAATDLQQGCPMPVAGSYIYGRVDGQPIVPAGALYAVRWPASIGTGPANMVSTSLQCGGEPLAFPFFFPWVVPLVEGCAQPAPGAYLRIAISSPNPFPLGFRLCEGGCP